MRQTYHHGNLAAELIRLGELDIASSGLEGFGLREVARKAGVTIGAVFRHFTSKDDLVRAVALEGFRALLSELRKADGVDAAARLRHGFESYLSLASQRPGCLRAMFGGVMERSSSESEVITSSGQAFAWLVEAVQSGQEEGWIRAQPAENLAVALFSALHGAATLHLEMGTFPIFGRLTTDALVDLLWDTHVRALRVDSVTSSPEPS